MPAEISTRRLLRGSCVVVDNFRCRPSYCGKSGEECSGGYQIVFVHRGAFTIHVGRQSVTADANHIVFFNKSAPYEVSHPVIGGDDCTAYGFRREHIAPMMELCDQEIADPQQPIFKVQQIACQPQFLSSHVSLMRRIQLGLLSDIAAEEAVLHMAQRILETAALQSPTQRRPRRVDTSLAHTQSAEAVRRLLAANYHRSLRLDAVAKSVHCSAYHLCRVFREQTGMSIHQYRNQLRLRASLEPLAESHLDIPQLALDLGFVDQSHFSNAFRRAFGLSPGAFRRRARGADIREMSRNLQV